MSTTPPCEREDASLFDIAIWKGLYLDEDRPGDLEGYADANDRFIPEWERRFEVESNGETRHLRSGNSRSLKSDLIAFGFSTALLVSVSWALFEFVVKGMTISLNGVTVPIYQPALQWFIVLLVVLWTFLLSVVWPHAPWRIGGGL